MNARAILKTPSTYGSMFHSMGRRSVSLESLASIQDLCIREKQRMMEIPGIKGKDDLDGYRGIRLALKDVVDQYQNPLNEQEEEVTKRREKRSMIVSTSTDPYALSKRTQDEHKGIAQKMAGAVKKVLKKDSGTQEAAQEQKELLGKMDTYLQQKDKELHKSEQMNSEMSVVLGNISRKLQQCLRDKERLEKENLDMSKRQQLMKPSAPSFERMHAETVRTSKIWGKQETEAPASSHEDQGNVQGTRATALSREVQGNEKQETGAPAPSQEDRRIVQGTKAPASSQDVQVHENQETDAPALSHDEGKPRIKTPTGHQNGNV